MINDYLNHGDVSLETAELHLANISPPWRRHPKSYVCPWGAGQPSTETAQRSIPLRRHFIKAFKQGASTIHQAGSFCCRCFETAQSGTHVSRRELVSPARQPAMPVLGIQ